MSRRKTDYFSSLPDELILKIFSSLPIKTSVSLSVLSYRFNRLLSLLPHHHLLLVDSQSPLPLFPNALLRRLEIPILNLLNARTIRSLLLSAVDCGVRELSLLNPKSYKSPIPNTIFQIKSLQTFSADHCRIVPSSIECTNLRTLKLKDSSIKDLSLDHLASACPGLEKLHLVNCIGCPRVVISSNSLKHLWLESAMSVKEIDVYAPELVTLTLYTRPELGELKIWAPEVRKAFLHLSHRKSEVQSVFQIFLSEAKNLHSLKLRGCSIQLFSKECATLERLNASFKKMRILSLSLDITSEQQALYLVKLLECCPCLEQLCVSIGQAHERRPEAIFEGFSDRMKLLECLANHLVDVEVHGFKAGLNDQEFVRILLNEAKSMKKMVLQFPGNRSNAVKGLLSDMNHPMKISSHHRKSCRVVLEL